jgi:predicted nuclease with TOPRIM domain
MTRYIIPELEQQQKLKEENDRLRFELEQSKDQVDKLKWDVDLLQQDLDHHKEALLYNVKQRKQLEISCERDCMIKAANYLQTKKREPHHPTMTIRKRKRSIGPL